MRDGKTQFGIVERKKFIERNDPRLAIDSSIHGVGFQSFG